MGFRNIEQIKKLLPIIYIAGFLRVHGPGELWGHQFGNGVKHLLSDAFIVFK